MTGVQKTHFADDDTLGRLVRLEKVYDAAVEFVEAHCCVDQQRRFRSEKALDLALADAGWKPSGHSDD